jgi:hypothetical protein
MNSRPQPPRTPIAIYLTRFDQRELPEHFTPSDHDIICGRGRAFAKHHGNKIFANAISSNLRRYVEAPKRIEKSVIAASIGSSLRETGARFVKQDKKSKRYYELSEDQAHDKIGHAFRDVLKALDSSIPKKTDCRGPLPKCVFSHCEKSGTKATIRQKEPAVPRALHKSLFSLNENACTKANISQKDSGIPLQHTSIPSMDLKEPIAPLMSISHETFSSLETISVSLISLDEDDDMTDSSSPVLPISAIPLDVFEKEQGLDRPLSLFLLDEDDEMTATMLANQFDVFEKEQDVDRPLALCSDTTFELQDIKRVYEIFS